MLFLANIQQLSALGVEGRGLSGINICSGKYVPGLQYGITGLDSSEVRDQIFFDLFVWFTSMRSLAEVLSDENRALLKIIKDTKPQSISSLVEAAGRKPGNLWTLNTMSNYGIVEMKRERNHVRPIAKATEFWIVA